MAKEAYLDISFKRDVRTRKRDLRIWQKRPNTGVMAAVRLLCVEAASGGVSRHETHAWESFYARILQQHLV